MAYIGQSLTEGTRREYSYVATAGQTVFPAIYTVGAVDVHQNGILLPPSDYTATDGTTVVFATGCAVDDEVVIHCHNTFSVADTYTKSESDDRFVNASGDTMTGALQTPYVNIRNAADTDNWLLYHYTDGSLRINRNGAGSDELVVSSEGRITLPYQPSFNAYKDDGHVSSGPVIFNGVHHNQGGHYSTSTGLFTAPVSGRYLISVMLMCNDGVTYNNSYYTFRVNGTTIKNVYSSNGGPYHHMFNHVQVINLSSGDTVGVNAANFTIYGTSAYYTTFSGHLLG